MDKTLKWRINLHILTTYPDAIGIERVMFLEFELEGSEGWADEVLHGIINFLESQHCSVGGGMVQIQ